jgi:MinD-like ATPase involved in chromosome partitioning or flagellar assembly
LMRDRMVEVPENAMVEERIALGLTAPQLAIVTAAVLLAAALNLAPVWVPVKVLLILLLPGPVAIAAVLSIRGQPAYRWLLWAARYWRSPKVWSAEVVPTAEADADKRLVSGVVVHRDDDSADEEAAVRGSTTIEAEEWGAVESGADNGSPATRGLAASSPPPQPAAHRSSMPEESQVMDGMPVRLRLIEPGESGPVPDDDHSWEGPERPPAVPFVLPGPRLVCFLSFVGGVGKTTLAVEAATYIANRAKYRTADGETLPVRTLLIDAARMSAAVGLRLGIHADDLSKAWTYRDWTAPDAALDARVQTRHGVDLITLPPHPQLAGLERSTAEDGADEFRAPEANSLLEAARIAGYQLVVADLGSVLEDGHRVLLKEAAVVVGVVRPTLESLPDVLRVANHLRNIGFARKLVIVANQCDDDTELRRFAHDAEVPLVAAVPPSPLFVAASNRQEPAWHLDPQLAAALLPVARTIWPLDSLGNHANSRGHSLANLLRRARGVVGRAGR